MHLLSGQAILRVKGMCSSSPQGWGVHRPLVLYYCTRKLKVGREIGKAEVSLCSLALSPKHRICTLRLPCWLRSEESTCQCRKHRFDPWPKKIPHATKQLRPCATTTESARAQELKLLNPHSCNYWSPRTLEPALRNKRSHCNEKPVHHDQE